MVNALNATHMRISLFSVRCARAIIRSGVLGRVAVARVVPPAPHQPPTSRASARAGRRSAIGPTRYLSRTFISRCSGRALAEILRLSALTVWPCAYPRRRPWISMHALAESASRLGLDSGSSSQGLWYATLFPHTAAQRAAAQRAAAQRAAAQRAAAMRGGDQTGR